MSTPNQEPDQAVISADRGFLPDSDPMESFNEEPDFQSSNEFLRELDALTAALPDQLERNQLRPAVEALPAMPEGLVAELNTRGCWRLCLLSGFLGSAYVHHLGKESADSIPASIAVPLYETSQRLGRKPMLAYDVLCLHNFCRHESESGFGLDNIDTLVDFTTHEDERWFVKIHIAIEAAAGSGLVAARRLHESVRTDTPRAVEAALDTIHESLQRQTSHMQRMRERNDPETFAQQYRPYYDGFDGVVYEGVDAFDEEPQSFRGGSGAQSLALPSFDAALGIDHSGTGLTAHLDSLRSYLPDSHLAVAQAFERGPDVRSYVAERDSQTMRESYNDCIDAISSFRTVHFGQTIEYIRRMTGDTTGTGGTDYEAFLQLLQSKTEEHRL
ncbi:indoleamine 2,3-dioxygenase [Halovenus rubra]|uniref:Indoleamine 2,3-dioxygenase n=2 Tax=Halovenus rubra TaxID=869890 RepID=A0ACC7E1G0_9EURY|nr:hypothetical protein [Halovenus rubra]